MRQCETHKHTHSQQKLFNVKFFIHTIRKSQLIINKQKFHLFELHNLFHMDLFDVLCFSISLTLILTPTMTLTLTPTLTQTLTPTLSFSHPLTFIL